jgi:hypothetical protein
MTEPMPQPTAPFVIGSPVWPGVAKVMEECGELVQVCGKLLASEGRAAHWDGTDLHVRLEEELADVLAAIAFLREHNTNQLRWFAVENRRDDKILRFCGWHNCPPHAEATA